LSLEWFSFASHFASLIWLSFCSRRDYPPGIVSRDAKRQAKRMAWLSKEHQEIMKSRVAPFCFFFWYTNPCLCFLFFVCPCLSSALSPLLPPTPESTHAHVFLLVKNPTPHTHPTLSLSFAQRPKTFHLFTCLSFLSNLPPPPFLPRTSPTHPQLCRTSYQVRQKITWLYMEHQEEMEQEEEEHQG
jgi:hypothetical protein